VLERAAILARGRLIRPEDLPDLYSPEELGEAPPRGGLKARVDSYERSLIAEALRHSAGNQSEAARQLHLSRATLAYKMKRCGL
jgi:DNA-binding NtrC family response regulator